MSSLIKSPRPEHPPAAASRARQAQGGRERSAVWREEAACAVQNDPGRRALSVPRRARGAFSAHRSRLRQPPSHYKGPVCGSRGPWQAPDCGRAPVRRVGHLPTTWACKGQRPWLEEGACQLPVRAQLQMSRQNRVFQPSLGHGADALVDGPRGRCRPARPSDNRWTVRPAGPWPEVPGPAAEEQCGCFRPACGSGLRGTGRAPPSQLRGLGKPQPLGVSTP